MEDAKKNDESPLCVSDERYAEHYNESDFWKKLQSISTGSVADIWEKALLLREVLLDSGTPLYLKASAVSVLGMFVWPLDMIPDFTPVFGFADDLAVMTAVLLSVDAFVSDDLRERARQRMPSYLRKEIEGEPSPPE